MARRPSLVSSLAWLAVLAVLPGFPASAVAGSDDWVRYENQHFVAYSNAAEKRARSLLGDLEAFRAAFLQFGNVTVPPGSPKTVVLITASKKEFKNLSPIRLAAGFATSDGRRTLIVMPAQGDRDWTTQTIRHEYGHALLRYKQFAYPAWYEEGFAELVSATELVKDGQAFTVGAGTERAKSAGPPIYDWDILVSEEFAPHEMQDLRRGSSAYLQAWLLAHYATLGDNLKNATRLQAYFDRLKEGEGYTAAFEESFGVKVEDLWETTLKPYARRMPFYTFNFRPGALDNNFVASAPAAGEVEGQTGFLDLREALRGEPRPPADGIAALAGRWAPLRIGLECTDFVDVAPAAGGVTIAFSGPADRPSPFPGGAYRPGTGPDGATRLSLDETDDAGPLELVVRYHTPDLMCLADAESGDECRLALHRCAR